MRVASIFAIASFSIIFGVAFYLERGLADLTVAVLISLAFSFLIIKILDEGAETPIDGSKW